MSGLDWFPMCRRSRNPDVMRRAHLSPCLSRSAFVATVVPILIQSIREESTGSAGGRGRPNSCNV